MPYKPLNPASAPIGVNGLHIYKPIKKDEKKPVSLTYLGVPIISSWVRLSSLLIQNFKKKREEWDAIPQSMLNSLVASFEGRMKEVVAVKGWGMIG